MICKTFLFQSHLDQTLTDQLASQKQSQSLKVPELSDEERRKIMNSAEFTRFFEKSTRVIERALVEEVNQHIKS